MSEPEGETPALVLPVETAELNDAIERLKAHLDYAHGVPPVTTIAQAATDLALVLKAAKAQLAAAIEQAKKMAWMKAHPEELRCRVCGNPEFGHETATRAEWLAHHTAAYDEAREYNADKTNASHYADKVTEERFGPEPPEGQPVTAPGSPIRVEAAHQDEFPGRGDGE